MESSYKCKRSNPVQDFFEEMNIPYEGTLKEQLDLLGVVVVEDLKPVSPELWMSIVKLCKFNFITIQRLDAAMSELRATGRYNPRLVAGLRLKDVSPDEKEKKIQTKEDMCR